MDTVTPYSTRMEQRLSEDPLSNCLFGSDSITDAIQFRSDMFHMDICTCDNTGSSLDCLGLGFGFNSQLLSNIEDDPIGFEKSRSSTSNLEDLNLDSDSELALTLDPNLILPHNGPIRSPTPGSEVPMLGASTKKRSVIKLEEEETENDSEPERTENDEESEDEEEEESENEENEHNETEYETAEDVTEEEEEDEEEDEEEEEEEAEDEEEEDNGSNAIGRRPPPLSLETSTSIVSSTMAVYSSTIQLTRVQMQQHTKSINTTKVQDMKMLTANSTAGGQTSHHIRKQVYNNNLHDIGSSAVTTVMIQSKREKDPTAGHIENPYPKPAYSYSCLIAMALKNSRTGSLPVSEIYNFMCRHFPYFKTAPNGWKNSVRHNLSLNKCFEKIEKPPGSGSQRKGCLWAIHPSKVAKMDEEVRKWSRKDPVAIKRAMVCPDQLELLERGEMKYEGDGHEEMYEDAESYASSENETGGDEADVNDDVTEDADEKQIDVEGDIVVEDIYDDIDIDDDDDAGTDVLDTRLITNNFSKQEQSFVYELVSCQKRPKTVTGLRNDYVYQQIDVPTPRKKAHVVAIHSSGIVPESGNP